MTDNEHKYPADEFDNPPSGPIGMHRGNRSLAVRIVPYLVTIVIAVLLGALAWAFFSGAFNSRTDASVAQSSSTAAESSSSASAVDTASSSSSDASSTDASSADASSTESSADATASSDSSSSAEESPSESSSSSAAANTAAQIVVYNGSGVTGAAASNAQTLENNGYTNVTATNPADYNSLPSATTVWYRTDADLATAQDVAAKLGVSQVVQAGNISSDVAVVLR
ncbi:LytR C-terminal domain-containing protein [Pseudoscardovia suis]|uniref:Cell wall integrity and stress response protein 1 n=1 Tax=Pseudoscardovia suis TaxID=987063 RepID=A0A261F196_9BIFI|nr:LytR C-terminal domain-containing protein [Pseudoscardovia suis]OZG52890.1 cell wall integrity and stress response protein 1 [Pseudoscardovia suis]PJJ68395.1 LytR cell envelope-related transcriptional attenuator [Pseudoscardovia suis]